MNTNYITQNISYTSSAYLVLHKALFSGKYKGMNNSCRVLYSLLLERAKLSAKNHFFDENGNAYCFFTREEASEILGLSQRTVCKLFKELVALDLIEDLPQKHNLANKIYVKLPEECEVDEKKTEKKKEERMTMLRRRQKTLKKLNLDIKVKTQKLKSITNQMEKAKKAIQEEGLKKELFSISSEMRNEVKEHVEYEWLLEHKGYLQIDDSFLETVITAIAEMKASEKTKIGDCYYSHDDVDQVLQRLDSCFFMEFLQDFRKKISGRKIRNLKAYLKTCLIHFMQDTLLLLDCVPRSINEKPVQRHKYSFEGFGLFA